MNRHLAVALLLLLGCTCISTNQAVRPGGDDARITLADRASLQGELLAVTQADLYFLSAQRVWRCPLTELRNVRIEGYDMKAGKYVILALFGVADATLTVFWASTGCWPMALPAIPLLAAGAWASLNSGPRSDHRFPLTESSRSQLALYCRYPRGSSDAQWQELLSFYHQDRFLQPGESSRP